MSIQMFDSIDVGSLPPGAVAYAGYVGGEWPTFAALKSRFSGASLLSVAIASDEFAMCLDVESGNATNAQVYDWYDMVKGTYPCPVIYTSASNVAALIATMTANKIPRNGYLIWSAHYTGAAHVCSPSACGYPQADGTQWTDDAVGGSCDESLLLPYFFTAITNPNPTEPTPAKPSTEDDEEMILIPGTTSPPVGKSFPSSGAYSTMGLVGDPSLAGAESTRLRVAFHLNGGGWSIDSVTVGTGAGPKTVVAIPANADGVSITRLDSVNVTLIPNFA